MDQKIKDALEFVEGEKRLCNCKLCSLSRRFTEALEKLDKKELKAAWNELGNMFINETFDADVNKAILDGTWPSAKHYLIASLEKVKEAEEREKHKYSKDTNITIYDEQS